MDNNGKNYWINVGYFYNETCSLQLVMNFKLDLSFVQQKRKPSTFFRGWLHNCNPPNIIEIL